MNLKFTLGSHCQDISLYLCKCSKSGMQIIFGSKHFEYKILNLHAKKTGECVCDYDISRVPRWGGKITKTNQQRSVRHTQCHLKGCWVISSDPVGTANPSTPSSSSIRMTSHGPERQSFSGLHPLVEEPMRASPDGNTQLGFWYKGAESATTFHSSLFCLSSCL